MRLAVDGQRASPNSATEQRPTSKVSGDLTWPGYAGATVALIRHRVPLSGADRARNSRPAAPLAIDPLMAAANETAVLGRSSCWRRRRPAVVRGAPTLSRSSLLRENMLGSL
jgi:hypothetical protein